MRKLIAVLLCIVFILPYIPVKAEEAYTFYEINIDAGEGKKSERAIIKNGEIYIPAENFSYYTRFSYDENDKMFLVKGQELKKAFKSVVIDIKKKRMLVSGTNFYKLSDCFEIEGELYLPLCQMLPVLNADIFEVKDNIIYISNNRLSLAEVLYDFDITDYYFNISTEFEDSGLLASFLVVPNYLLDSVVNFRYDRLDVITRSGDYKDYKEILSEFLADDNLYLKATAQGSDDIDSAIERFKKTTSNAEDMNTVLEWVEKVQESDISSERGGVLLDLLRDNYDAGKIKVNKLEGLSGAWLEDVITFENCVDTYNYIYTYLRQVDDNRQMLNAVYDIDSHISIRESDRRAAKQIYELYSGKVITAITKEITEKISDEVVDKFASPIAIYTATAKVAGVALDAVMPFSYGDISRLPLYSNVVISASSKYHKYSTSSDEETNNLRLSLLLCLTASKKCFSLMEESASDTGNDSSYYENKIEKIDKLIMGLYIAAENTEFDSYEHFDEHKKSNLKKVRELVDNPTPAAELIPPIEFVGKTFGDIKEYFGNDFVLDYSTGSRIVRYESEEIIFYLDTQDVDPSSDTKIIIALSYGDIAIIEKLNGKMTYDEVVTAVGSEISLEFPEKYNVEINGRWEYWLDFEYKGYSISFMWLEDPKTNASEYVRGRKIEDEKYATEEKEEITTTSSAPEETVANEDENSDYNILTDDVIILLEEIENYLQVNYSDLQLLDVEFYANYDGIISCYIKTEDDNSAYFGLEVNKESRQVKIYNTSGRIVDEFTLP